MWLQPILSSSWRASHDLITYMHHIHIRAIPVTKSCKTELTDSTTKSKSWKTLSYGPILTILILSNPTEGIRLVPSWNSLQVSFRDRLHPSYGSKVTAVLRTELFSATRRPTADPICRHRASHALGTWPRVQFDQSDWSLTCHDWIYMYHLTRMAEFRPVRVDRYKTNAARPWTKIGNSSKTAHITYATSRTYNNAV